MKNIYLGKERVKQDYLTTIYHFELLPRKYYVTYNEEENIFYFAIGKFLFGEYKSKKEAKQGLIDFIKKYQPNHLAKLNEFNNLNGKNIA